MTKTKKIFTSVLACIMMLCTLLVTPLTASATTSSYGTTQTRTITVQTKGNWWIPGSESITLKQTKGTCEKTTTNWITGKKSTKVSKEYGTWNIVAQATDGSHTVRKTLSGSSVKIPLKPDKTYKITVTWNSIDVTDVNDPTDYCDLTVSFGEFIGIKNSAYIDTNNCDFADQLLAQGIAVPTAFTKQSGMCEYPLWLFDEEKLKEMGAEAYYKYTTEYDKYFAENLGVTEGNK